MALVLHVAVVQESDYSALAPLCIRRVVSDNYAGFLANVEDYCKELESKGVWPIKTQIDPAAFKSWFGRTGATRADLTRYASIIAEAQVHGACDAHARRL